uniref:(northern house mosquito) hypothetical protein n=1 Tax=Culex pipiens TaxID=7175 RepID=A0A8D8L2F0_CULPI
MCSKISLKCLVKVILFFFRVKIIPIQTLHCLHNNLYLFICFYSSKSNYLSLFHNEGTITVITFFNSLYLFFYVKHKQFCLPAISLSLHYTRGGLYNELLLLLLLLFANASENHSTSSTYHHRHRPSLSSSVISFSALSSTTPLLRSVGCVVGRILCSF